MATGNVQGYDISVAAAADYSAASNQYKAVYLSAAGVFTIISNASPATQFPLGVLQDAPVSGQFGTIRTFGITKMVAGAAVVAGVPVKLDASGRAVTWVFGTDGHTTAVLGTAPDAATFDPIFGQALTAAGAAGDLLTVLILKNIV